MGSKPKRMGTVELREYRRSLSRKAARALLRVALDERRASLDKLGFDSYADYLNSATWRAIRARIFKRADGKCESCGWQVPANVHHWSYSVATLQGKKPEHLEAVCRDCHDEIHEEPPKPQQGQSPKQAAKAEYWALVRAGGAVKQPRDMKPRLVRMKAS